MCFIIMYAVAPPPPRAHHAKQSPLRYEIMIRIALSHALSTVTSHKTAQTYEVLARAHDDSKKLNASIAAYDHSFVKSYIKIPFVALLTKIFSN